MNKLPINNSTMSSREIASLVGSRHGDVYKSIERLIKSGVIWGYAATPYTHEQNGQRYSEYHVNERDSYVIVAQLSPEFTGKLVDRWQELEAKESFSLPKTYAEALRLAADQADKIALLSPKAEIFDMIVDRNNLYNATQVAQKLGQSAVWMNKQLSEFKVYNRTVKRGKAFQQWFVDAGYGIMRETESGHSQPMFFAEGEMWIIKKLTEEGLI